jgi:peroxisomal 3,2-trans-enoyl-CoA isomerase
MPTQQGTEILYEIRERTAIITLNLPKKFNALTGPEYRRLEQLVQAAAREKSTFVTLIQSTGSFFSAGANFKKGDLSGDTEDKISLLNLHNDGADPDNYADLDERSLWSYRFGTRNLVLTETFFNHPKVLVVALNGPVIGLSAALVATADLIFATDNTYLLAPFANIGLASEGAACYTLLQRLGMSKASEALLMSKPIPAHDLKATGFLNELYPKDKFKSPEEFNEYIYNKIKKAMYGLDGEAVLIIKKLIRRSWQKDIVEANHDEVFYGIDRFAKGVPQRRFAALATKNLNHKL